MTSGSLSATAVGVIALVVGLVMSWLKDAPRTRTALLITGSTLVVGGVFGKVSHQAGDTISSASAAATASLAGTAVGVVGLILLVWLIVRGTWKGGVSRWTDLASLVTPPLASASGGLVWSICLLVSGLVAWVITFAWGLGGTLTTLISSQVG